MSRRRPDGSIASGTIIDRYLVDVLLGTGGMGEVYAARDQQLGRTVALKILAPDRAADPSRVQRFLREAQLASSLSHPAIVTVYDSGSTTLADGRVVYFLAMELVDGETLSVWARSARDPQKIVELLAIVADGLARAHASGIVHRDLKPQNIMVARGGHPKILDFGVAKLIEPQPGVADSSETAPSQAVGTGAYMAPEQVEGVAVDHRADIFAFGAVMYEALTGRAPFARGTIVESMHAVLHDQPETPDVAPELARIIRKCLVKDREERYQSIKDVAIDLREALSAPSVGTSRAKARVHTGIAFGVAILLATFIALAFGRDRRNGPSALAAPNPVTPLMMRRVTNSGNISAGAVSPDGNYIVHSTVDGEN